MNYLIWFKYNRINNDSHIKGLPDSARGEGHDKWLSWNTGHIWGQVGLKECLEMFRNIKLCSQLSYLHFWKCWINIAIEPCWKMRYFVPMPALCIYNGKHGFDMIPKKEIDLSLQEVMIYLLLISPNKQLCQNSFGGFVLHWMSPSVSGRNIRNQWSPEKITTYPP